MTGPGRRIELKTVPRDVSRFAGVRPGLGTHPHADQSIHRSGGSLSGHPQSSLPVRRLPSPRVRQIDGLLELGGLYQSS